jgi:hypothetical protein
LLISSKLRGQTRVNWKVAAGVGIIYSKCKMILTKALGTRISAKFFPQVTKNVMIFSTLQEAILGQVKYYNGFPPTIFSRSGTERHF